MIIQPPQMTTVLVSALVEQVQVDARAVLKRREQSIKCLKPKQNHWILGNLQWLSCAITVLVSLLSDSSPPRALIQLRFDSDKKWINILVVSNCLSTSVSIKSSCSRLQQYFINHKLRFSFSEKLIEIHGGEVCAVEYDDIRIAYSVHLPYCATLDSNTSISDDPFNPSSFDRN